VADFAFGMDPGDMLDNLLIMAQTGVAARKQQAIRVMVGPLSFDVTSCTQTRCHGPLQR
jgi:hypothetical protein